MRTTMSSRTARWPSGRWPPGSGPRRSPSSSRPGQAPRLLVRRRERVVMGMGGPRWHPGVGDDQQMSSGHDVLDNAGQDVRARQVDRGLQEAGRDESYGSWGSRLEVGCVEMDPLVRTPAALAASAARLVAVTEMSTRWHSIRAGQARPRRRLAAAEVERASGSQCRHHLNKRMIHPAGPDLVRGGVPVFPEICGRDHVISWHGTKATALPNEQPVRCLRARPGSSG